jgi:hypothetical protein
VAPRQATGMIVMNLIPAPPKTPSVAWLYAFAKELMRLNPHLPEDNAIRCAVLAHPGTWLLEPQEAADWWLAAVNAAARELPTFPREPSE